MVNGWGFPHGNFDGWTPPYTEFGDDDGKWDDVMPIRTDAPCGTDALGRNGFEYAYVTEDPDLQAFADRDKAKRLDEMTEGRLTDYPVHGYFMDLDATMSAEEYRRTIDCFRRHGWPKVTIGGEPLHKLRWGKYCGMRHSCKEKGAKSKDATAQRHPYSRACGGGTEQRKKCDDAFNKCMDDAPATVVKALKHGNDLIRKLAEAFSSKKGLFGGFG
eukprot:gene24957-67263_t